MFLRKAGAGGRVILDHDELARLASENATEAIFVTDRECRILYVNPAFTVLSGYSAMEALGAAPRLFATSHNAPLYAEMWRTVLAGDTWRGRFLNRRKTAGVRSAARSPDGDPRLYWVDSTIRPILDPGREVIGFVSVQRDVTDDVLAEDDASFVRDAAEARARIGHLLQQRRPIEDRVGAVLDVLVRMGGAAASGRGGVLLLDQDPAVLRLAVARGRFGGTLAAPAVAVQSSPCRAAIEDRAVVVVRDCRDCQEEGETVRHGHYFVPLLREGGCEGVLFTFTPVEPKDSATRRAMLRDAGEVVGLALANERARVELARAREDALLAARAKSEFLANMSHELRTPLNSVIGFSDLMDGEDLDAQRRDYLRAIRSGAETLLSVIDEVLVFSKLEAGKVSLEQTPFDLRDVIEGVGELLGPSAADKGVELVVRIDPEVPDRVVGDAARLRQVLLNLAGNAVKFTDAGEIELGVTGVPGRPERFHFYVRDTGIGIPKDRQAAVFDSFTQADGSTTRRFGGTGLGLAISRGLVELMGGGIELRSEEGRGSTFRFDVPLGAAPNPARRSLGALSVLLVESNVTARAALGELLRSGGCRVRTVERARRAVEGLARTRFDVAVVAHVLPDDLGASLAERLCDSGLPVVVVGPAGHVTLPDRLHETGRVATAGKPVRRDVLFDAIDRARGVVDESAIRATALVTQRNFGLRVLLVEDNPINRTLAVRMLEKLGCSVEVAENGREAIERLVPGRYDLVLMDVQMPEMDGLEATRRMLAIAGEDAPPIVAMTAHALEGDRDRCLAVGMAGYLSKPVKLSDLARTLEAFTATTPS